MKPASRWGWAALSAAALLATGCGLPGAPLPPSLKLPDPVADLAAARTGNQVSLTWTMPKKNTDKLLLKGNVPVSVCRKEDPGTCAPAADNLMLAPGASGAFTETLPPALASGPPRPLAYFVELKNRNGRSAGLSNAAIVLAGEAPAPVAGLAAQVRKDGVLLRWTPDSEKAAIRLHRKLLTPQPSAASAAGPKPPQGILAPPPEPIEQSLLVDSGAQADQSGPAPDRALDRALDKDIRFGQTYEYRAQRVARVTVSGKTLELDGELSAPVRVEALDIFPPEAPTGLAAVATAPSATTEAAIDLSWQPNTEADLAGYAVYRLEPGGANGIWQRISPAEPLVAPAFHDTQVQPGHTYRYAVSAIDRAGHESARSAEAEESVPNP
jgi:hypothetical protein